MKKRLVIIVCVAAVVIASAAITFVLLGGRSSKSKDKNLYENGAIIGEWFNEEYNSTMIFYEDGTCTRGNLVNDNTWDIVDLETALAAPLGSDYNLFLDGMIESSSRVARSHFDLPWGLDMENGETFETAGWAEGSYVLCMLYRSVGSSSPPRICPYPFVFLDENTLVINIDPFNHTLWFTYKRVDA